VTDLITPRPSHTYCGAALYFTQGWKKSGFVGFKDFFKVFFLGFNVRRPDTTSSNNVVKIKL